MSKAFNPQAAQYPKVEDYKFLDVNVCTVRM